jgi:hypothetical protein
VPPVTAERSPPLSRITGADSPVMADSSTSATPSMTSPSAGMVSSASTSTISPARSAWLGTVSYSQVRLGSCGRTSSLAGISLPSACRWPARVLPRASAMASAKLARKTVSQHQAATWPVKATRDESASRRAQTRRKVVRMAATSITSMTGLAMRTRGSSPRRAAHAACPASDAPNSLMSRDPAMPRDLTCSGCLAHRRVRQLLGSWSRARLSSSTLTRRSPNRPNVRCSVRWSTNARTASSDRPRAAATLGT